MTTSTTSQRQAGETARLWATRPAGSGTVLLLEPDPQLAADLCQSLTGLGVELVCVSHPLRALARLGLDAADVVVVSADLEPTLLVNFIDAVHSETSVPVLLASGPQHADVLGPAVLAGARPVVSLPYDPHALVRSLREAVPATAPRPLLSVGELTLDLAAYSARYGAKLVHLSAQEFVMLHELALHVDEPVPREWFFERFWPTSPNPRTTLGTAVSKLRRRLERQGVAAAAVQTIWRVGYQLESRHLSRHP